MGWSNPNPGPQRGPRLPLWRAILLYSLLHASWMLFEEVLVVVEKWIRTGTPR